MLNFIWNASRPLSVFVTSIDIMDFMISCGTGVKGSTSNCKLRPVTEISSDLDMILKGSENEGGGEGDGNDGKLNLNWLIDLV